MEYVNALENAKLFKYQFSKNVSIDQSSCIHNKNPNLFYINRQVSYNIYISVKGFIIANSY